MHHIESNQLKVSINEKGAELNSIWHKQFQIEYLWNADPKFWEKKSPVLFPIVGTLKNNSYFFNQKKYTLSRHGFARDLIFMLTHQQRDSITFTLHSNEDTLTNFPFLFQFNITYTVSENELSVTYTVINKEKQQAMYFSVGGHPAFKVPLAEGSAYEDYVLVFNKQENAGRWPISKEGLIEKHAEVLLENTNMLHLTKDLFKKDALVFKNLQSDRVKLHSDKTNHGLEFYFQDFPFLGLWAAPDANFVCIEPWCGIADSIDSNQQLTEKEGINFLNAGSRFNATWRVILY